MTAVNSAITVGDSNVSDKAEVMHIEDDKDKAAPTDTDLEYNDDDEEPGLHARTYVALVALFVLNYVQVVALNGPPSVLNYLGKDLNGTANQVWVPNALSLVQAVMGPGIAFASDLFQARKPILIGASLFSFVGAAIAPGAKDIYRVIVSQILIGIGFSAAPLALAIPSEILPRKWRPLAQSLMNIAGGVGSLCAPLITGSLTKRSEHSGWRNFYWTQMAMWGFTIVCLFIGYRPPKRHTRLDHLSLPEKVKQLDLPGLSLLASGLTLLLAGLNLGGNPWAWTNVRVLVTLVLGILMLIAFIIYEWKGTKTGVLDHSLFRRRTFALCIALMFIEGIMLFSVMIFYPEVVTLFTTDPLEAGVRQIPYWIGASMCTIIYGFWSSKRRTIRSPMFAGFVIWTAALAGMATVQPNQSANSLVFNGLAGLGFAGPLILLITGVQLASPHELIATATSILISSRAVAAAVFTAIYGAAVSSSVPKKLPAYTATAAIRAGLAPENVEAFVGTLLSEGVEAAANIPGATPTILAAGAAAMKQAFADSYRLVFIIAAPFGALACMLCYFIDDLSELMTYHVDAPVEELHAKNREQESQEPPA